MSAAGLVDVSTTRGVADEAMLDPVVGCIDLTMLRVGVMFRGLAMTGGLAEIVSEGGLRGALGRGAATVDSTAAFVAGARRFGPLARAFVICDSCPPACSIAPSESWA